MVHIVIVLPLSSSQDCVRPPPHYLTLPLQQRQHKHWAQAPTPPFIVRPKIISNMMNGKQNIQTNISTDIWRYWESIKTHILSSKLKLTFNESWGWCSESLFCFDIYLRLCYNLAYFRWHDARTPCNILISPCLEGITCDGPHLSACFTPCSMCTKVWYTHYREGSNIRAARLLLGTKTYWMVQHHICYAPAPCPSYHSTCCCQTRSGLPSSISHCTGAGLFTPL